METKGKIINALTGFAAGFASAALGIGGGVVIMPVLLLVLRYDYKRSVTASLAAITMSVIVGILSHYMIDSSAIMIRAALFMIMGSIIGARTGAWLVQRLSSTVLTRTLALFLAFISLKLAGLLPLSFTTVGLSWQEPALVLLGFTAGISSALFGIGGGVVIVPVLTVFFGFPIHRSIPTSLAVILPTTLAGALFHHTYNGIDTRLVRFLVPLSLLGAVLGAMVAHQVSPEGLKRIFGIFLLIISVRMFFQGMKKE